MSKNTITVLVAILVIIGGIVLYSLNKMPVAENAEVPSVPNVPAEKTLALTAGPVVGTVKSDTLGEYLTTKTGMALYVFTDDKKLESVCKDACAATWIPFEYDNQDLSKLTDPLSKRLNVAKARADGSRQYAYGQMPLYLYVGDKAPGEVKGNGMSDGKWKIVVLN